jgi:hypothetical protein
VFSFFHIIYLVAEVSAKISNARLQAIDSVGAAGCVILLHIGYTTLKNVSSQSSNPAIPQVLKLIASFLRARTRAKKSRHLGRTRNAGLRFTASLSRKQAI